jgi:excisionase family DNA binding protein
VDVENLTTPEAARLLGVSRQHLADLADQGQIASWRVGTHRRFNTSDLIRFKLRRAGESHRALVRDAISLTDLRSWIYGVLVASRLAEDPVGVIDIGRANLRKQQEVHGDESADPLLNKWDQLLRGSSDELLEVLVSPSQFAAELRHSSPFAGVLSSDERHWVIRTTRGLQ